MDLRTMTDEELAAHLNAVINEQERRARLARVPDQVAQMTAQYVADGGDKATIIDVLSSMPRSDEDA